MSAAISAAMTNETIATVPTFETASPESTKMPAAIIVRMPIASAPKSPMLRSSSVETSPSSAVASLIREKPTLPPFFLPVCYRKPAIAVTKLLFSFPARPTVVRADHSARST